MKNQYFGDINDYRKYGLLRSILNTTNVRMLVAWMLTPDDGSTDGRFISYLENPARWADFDPTLFHELKALLRVAGERRVSLIEDTELLRGANYFGTRVPEPARERRAWFSSLLEKSRNSNFVFLDPDNGIEVKSKPYGRKNSSKYLYWHEIKSLWSDGKSLLIYQHFVRKKRIEFIQTNLEALRRAAPDSLVQAFVTPHVVFLMALQPEHHDLRDLIMRSVGERWLGEIRHWPLPEMALDLRGKMSDTSSHV